MSNPNQIVNTNGLLRSVYGPEANEAFMLRTLILGLELEIKGIRVSAAVNMLAAAKGVTGLKSNKREDHIARAKEMMKEALDKCDIINAPAGTPPLATTKRRRTSPDGAVRKQT